jgi:hypothetical protein
MPPVIEGQEAVFYCCHSASHFIAIGGRWVLLSHVELDPIFG